MDISLDLVSLILGVVLGINLLLLYQRFFSPVSKRERTLNQRIRELERRLSDKDKLIRKAVKSAVDEHRSSQ
jgi:membrane protein implicated in regulation of membrane protease activity